MVEREVLKDIKEYKPRFIGPLSLRNFVCGGIGVVCGLSVAAITYALGFIIPVCMLTGGIACVPGFVCGWFEPYGVPFEKFIVSFFQLSFIAPKKRKYAVENYDLYAPEQSEKPLTKAEKKELKNLENIKLKEAKELGEDFIPFA